MSIWKFRSEPAGNVEALVKAGVTDDKPQQVVAAIKKHVETIESLRQSVA